MKTLLISLVCSVSTGVEAALVDFNSEGDLANFFQPAFTNPAIITPGVGLAGSGGVTYLAPGSYPIQIYSPVVISPNGSRWESAIYFKHRSFLQYTPPMVGFIGKDPTYGEFVSPYATVPAIYAVATYNTLSLTGGPGFLASANVFPLLSETAWYRLLVEVEFLGTGSDGRNSYDVRASLTPSDEIGTLGSPIAVAEKTFSTTQFSGTNELFGFFGATGSTFYGVTDNFHVIPEPAIPIWFFGSAVILGGRRIRRRS